MPTLDDLNEIKSNLLSLGDEPGILAAKGETPVDIGPPETGISEDLNALFDGFADVEEETDSTPEQLDELTVPPAEGVIPDSLVPELVEGFEDFDLDFDDEPAFDMDGFDAPESSERAVPEQFDTSASSVQRELTVPPGDEFDEDFNVTELDADDLDSQSEDLGFEDLVGFTESDEPESTVPEQFDTSASSVQRELTVPLVEGDNDSFELGDIEEDGSLPDEIDLGEELDLSVPELAEGSVPETVEVDDFDLSGTDSDLSFDDSDMESTVPELVERAVPELVERAVPEQFDTSASSVQRELTVPLAEEDDFEMPEDEIDLGVDEEFSLDDSDAGDMDLDEFEISDDNFDEDLEIDEFDLGDLGQDFGVLEDDHPSISVDTVPEPSVPELVEGEGEEFEIEEKSFERVKESLQNLPRNLKLIIEEEIGEKGLKGPSLEKLISALAEGKSPKEIASITSKIVGKKIKIPANYTKRTGSDFEEEKDSFQYALIHRILPLLKIFLISFLIISGISYVSYKFIYRPVHAYILYNRGYEQLEESNYNRSAEIFDQAVDKYKMKKQYYRYAEGYIESNQWEFARTQYDKLLLNYPFDKKGTIDYATMEFEKLSDYEYSTDILNNFLSEDKFKRDYEALFLLGDIYLEWGWENYDKYEEARLAYAKIMSTYGLEDKILFRMLRYFIRTDNAKEVEILKRRFQTDKDQDIDPLAYAELAGYQIDRQDIDDVQELLFRAKDMDKSIPEIHYQLARLFNLTGEGGEEDKALNKTLLNLENIQTLNRRNREIKIDTYRRLGERFYVKEEYLQAEEAYNKGLDLLKESRERNIIKGKSSVYGQLYADLGHIYYYISENPDNALELYETAEGEGFYSPEIFYNKGNIRYRSGNFRQALLEFYNSAGSFSVNTNLLQATANTLYQRNDYFAAQGYYNHLLDILEMKINREFSIRINEREDHRTMVESLMKAYNNIGVTLYGLFERTGDPSKFTAAILSFTQSNEYFDDLTRDPETLNRTDMVNLAALNQRKMLYPIPNYELQIFADIPKRLDLR